MSDFVKETPEYLEICGIKYAKVLFEAWGEKGMDIGTLFRLLKREDGVITIKTIREHK